MISLDSINPANGDVLLKPGDYELSKAKDLGNVHWRKDGTGSDPVVYFAGHENDHAFGSSGKNNPTISDFRFACAPGTNALASGGNLLAERIHVDHGGGLLLMQGGGPGLTKLVGGGQLAPSKRYVFYCSGRSQWVKDASGKIVGLDEINSDRVIIDGVDAMFGSLYDACGRFSGCNRVEIRNGHWSDTAAQSAPGAVPNSVLRAHGDVHAVMDLFVENQALTGEAIFVGPYTYDKDAPAGFSRDLELRRRIRSITFVNCPINVRTSVIAPGVRKLIFDRCPITTRTNAVFQAGLAADKTRRYLVQEQSVVEVRNCALHSLSTAHPTVFGGEDKRGWEKMIMIGGSLKGQ